LLYHHPAQRKVAIEQRVTAASRRDHGGRVAAGNLNSTTVCLDDLRVDVNVGHERIRGNDPE
jgi:hypothetical protein